MGEPRTENTGGAWPMKCEGWRSDHEEYSMSVSEEDGGDVIENGYDTEALEIDYVEVCEQDEKSVWSKGERKGGHTEW